MKRSVSSYGFTLIELLVVVTIIVVLLALLVPAMDRAIYNAEMAVCGTKLRTVAVGALTYAADSKRRYPDRPSVRSNGSCRAVDLYFGANQLPLLDDRIILKQFLSLNKALNCPMVQEIDIEGSDADSAVLSTYALFFGTQYVIGGVADKGMFKLGDRLTYTEVGDGSAPAAVSSFNVLASDWDGIYVDNDRRSIATHPDLAGGMASYSLQDENYVDPNAPAVPPFKATFSYWSGLKRAPIDTNYAYDDGSVERFNGVQAEEGDPDFTGERRFTWVPQSNVDNQLTWKLQLPVR